MKAWLLDNIGDGIDKLNIAELAEPSPAANEVVIDVKFAALNPADRYLAENLYPARPALPHILGRDGMGVVSSIGPGVAGIRPGDRMLLLRGDVGINRPGMFAQKAVVPTESLAPIPTGWSDQEAAGAATVFLTVHQSIFQWDDLPTPAVVLVTGASGGVGVATVQLASAIGHTVIGLSRSPEKSSRLRQLGAAATFDPNDKDWRKKLKDFLVKRRIDLVVENIGGPLFNECIDTLGDRGRVSVVGRLAGPVPNFNTASLIFRRVRIAGVQVGAYTNAQTRAAWEQIVGALGKTGAKPVVDRVFPFGELRTAFSRLEEGPMGKVLLAVN
jgi:NADPH2:quinone reductase